MAKSVLQKRIAEFKAQQKRTEANLSDKDYIARIKDYFPEIYLVAKAGQKEFLNDKPDIELVKKYIEILCLILEDYRPQHTKTTLDNLIKTEWYNPPTF